MSMQKFLPEKKHYKTNSPNFRNPEIPVVPNQAMLRCQLIQPIIDGSTCTVWRARSACGMWVAVKLLNDPEQGLSEASTYELFNHPNIINILATNVFKCPNDRKPKFGIILPIFDMDLRSFINYMPTILQRESIQKLQIQIKLQTAAALAHVHEECLCHADLKPENFLINSASDMSVFVQLADMGSAINISPMACPTRPITLITTILYQAPEVTRKEMPFYGSCSDVYSLGIIFHEVEQTSEQEDSNQISLGEPLSYFTHLAQDMIQYDHYLRPTMPKVLERLGESMELLSIKGSPCDDIVANMLENKMDIISSTSYDKSLGLHRLLTLLRSDKSDYIEAAYWLLESLAVKEGFTSTYPTQSVLSILPQFHTRLHVNDNDVGRSTFNKLMYCRALEALCQRPYFMLSDDMKLNLRAFSVIPACERSVLMVMATTAETFPEILEWCKNGKWGKFGDRFDVFLDRFTDDWRLDVASIACQMLGMPPPTVDYTFATEHIVLLTDVVWEPCVPTSSTDFWLSFFSLPALSDQHGLEVSTQELN